MRLFVIADYHCREIYHRKGTVLDVDAKTAAWLLVDAPGCFALKPPEEEKEISTAPADKMQRRSKPK